LEWAHLLQDHSMDDRMLKLLERGILKCYLSALNIFPCIRDSPLDIFISFWNRGSLEYGSSVMYRKIVGVSYTQENTVYRAMKRFNLLPLNCTWWFWRCCWCITFGRIGDSRRQWRRFINFRFTCWKNFVKSKLRQREACHEMELQRISPNKDSLQLNNNMLKWGGHTNKTRVNFIYIRERNGTLQLTKVRYNIIGKCFIILCVSLKAPD